MSRAKALAIAARFGFVLDEYCSGPAPLGGFSAIFDHPTHSIAADCRSITVFSHPPKASVSVWAEAIERMQEEGPLLTPCTDPDCEYHHGETE